ncbi:hypothetical protein DB43_HK00610 [Parachlamydia acanthamoebae]|uniref:Uncharacterized protein n=1 Tax=Parachlamydia acanthamoebae TaxID=83552 RepID=A0A0C1E9L6_9BACT|nr:hypothetical protein DB43_HK00610 [Parachlamydia acanthamoebae]
MHLNKTVIFLLILFIELLSKNLAFGNFKAIETIKSEMGDDDFNELKKHLFLFSKIMNSHILFLEKNRFLFVLSALISLLIFIQLAR